MRLRLFESRRWRPTALGRYRSANRSEPTTPSAANRTHKCLFEGELSDDDKLVYVIHVLKGKLMESDLLRQQPANNTNEQFANSPDLAHEILNAVLDALAAHTTMSKQALDSDRVRSGLKDILLGPAQLYEALREDVRG